MFGECRDMEKQILSKSRFHEVIALSETEIGKKVIHQLNFSIHSNRTEES